MASYHDCSDDLDYQVVQAKAEDCTILEGHRGEERQNQMISEGKSQLSFPNSNHNGSPASAVDVAPYPIDWSNRDRFHYFAGYVMGTAQSLGYPLRWGGDWDSDTETNDNQFDDLVHFELGRTQNSPH